MDLARTDTHVRHMGVDGSTVNGCELPYHTVSHAGGLLKRITLNSVQMSVADTHTRREADSCQCLIGITDPTKTHLHYDNIQDSSVSKELERSGSVQSEQQSAMLTGDSYEFNVKCDDDDEHTKEACINRLMHNPM